jgi:TPR repeat protein
VSAAYNVGVLHTMNFPGHPSLKNTERALTHFRIAANHGHVAAMNNLGVILTESANDEATRKEGLTWLGKAAVSGHPSAQYNIGKIYLAGELARQDKVEAYFWINQASLSGNEKAGRMLNQLADEMTVDELLEAQRKAKARRDAAKAEKVAAAEKADGTGEN